MTPLTFSAAMALDPGEVEVQLMGCSGWSPFRLAMNFKHADFRLAAFRRARPSRSRVQEMADEPLGTGCTRTLSEAAAYYAGLAEAIRAVCEFVAGKYFDADVDVDIKREFLEPR